MLATGDQALRDLEDFWIPLIGLQLNVTDLTRRHGLWVFEVNARGEKTIKTKAAERTVPVHQRLVELGLLDYRDFVAAKGFEQLFPAAKPAADGYASSSFSKRFSRLLTRIGIKTDRKLTFHSFRHTLKDLLRNAGVDQASQFALLGHEEGTAAAAYGGGYSIDTLHRALHRIEVPVDLSHLLPETAAHRARQPTVPRGPIPNTGGSVRRV